MMGQIGFKYRVLTSSMLEIFLSMQIKRTKTFENVVTHIRFTVPLTLDPPARIFNAWFL